MATPILRAPPPNPHHHHHHLLHRPLTLTPPLRLRLPVRRLRHASAAAATATATAAVAPDDISQINHRLRALVRRRDGASGASSASSPIDPAQAEAYLHMIREQQRLGLRQLRRDASEPKEDRYGGSGWEVEEEGGGRKMGMAAGSSLGHRVDPRELEPGEYVVHKKVGVGKFTCISGEDGEDYVFIQYADGMAKLAVDQATRMLYRYNLLLGGQMDSGTSCLRNSATTLRLRAKARRRRSLTVADGLAGNCWAHDIHGVLGVQEVGQYLQIWQLITPTTLSTAPDKLVWKWTADGEYTTKSAYLASFHRSTSSKSWKLISKSWAPNRVKFFHWLADMDRCWTAERLERHHLQHHPRCLLCDQDQETMLHLTITCPLSRQVWHEVLAWLRMTCRSPANATMLLEWWTKAKLDTPRAMYKGLASADLLIPWMIWKHRNDCVFDRARPCILGLIAKIKDEGAACVGLKGFGM